MRIQNPVVSIIIPTYNYAHLIVETLEGVRLQTFENWECIVVDDGSSDDTKEVVANYLSKQIDERFKYKRTSNKGTSAAKNYGLGLAAGLYIQFLDADDILSRDKLKMQTSILEKTNANLVFSKSLFFYDIQVNGPYIKKYPTDYLANRSLEGNDLMTSIIKNNLFTISSPLVRHSMIKDKILFNESINNNEDWLFWFEVACLHSNFIYDDCEDSFVLIRLHESSAMKNESKMFQGEIRVREYFSKKLHGKLKELNLKLLALHNVRSVDYRAGFIFIFKRFLSNPVRNINLLSLGIFKGAVRIYKIYRG